MPARADCIADIAPVDHPDAVVDNGDLLQVMSHWGPCPSGCPADLDDDFEVGYNDLTIVLSQWGSCDLDGDGMSDTWELEHGLDPNDAFDAIRDFDLDGLSNIGEWERWTLPNDFDTDDDGGSDGYEVMSAADPLDPGDGGEGPEADDVVWIKLTVGDQSGSGSEIWRIVFAGTAYENPAGVPDEWTSPALPVKRGNTFPIQLQWVSGEGDYDYTAKVDLSSDLSIWHALLYNTASGEFPNCVGGCPGNPACCNNWEPTLPKEGGFIADPQKLLGKRFDQDWCPGGDHCDWTVGRTAYLMLPSLDQTEHISRDNEIFVASANFEGTETNADAVAPAFADATFRYRLKRPGSADLVRGSQNIEGLGVAEAFDVTTDMSSLGAYRSILEYFDTHRAEWVVVHEDPFALVASEPASITLEPFTTELLADGVSSAWIVAYVDGADGTPVEDGTPVTWAVLGEPARVEPEIASTISGVATTQVFAPEGPVDADLLVRAQSAEAIGEITLALLNIDGALTTSHPVIDLAQSPVVHATLSVPGVADGAEVVWTLSRGTIIGAMDPELGPRMHAGVVAAGQASIAIDAEPLDDDGYTPLSSIGDCLVSATVANHLFHLAIPCIDTRPFTVEVEHRVLAGDQVDDGVVAVPFAEIDALPDGQTPEVVPSFRLVPYHAQSVVTIRGEAGSYVNIYWENPADGQFVQVEEGPCHDPGGSAGQGSNFICGIPLETGECEILLQSTGALSSVDGWSAGIRSVQLRFDYFEPPSVVGLDEPDFTTREQVEVVESTPWTYLLDGVAGFFGGDPETAVGLGANMLGGIVIVGDIGACVKNLWRMAGLSDTEVNELEFVLSGIGLATEFLVGAGEIADVPISGTRAIVAAVGPAAPLAKACVFILKKAIANVSDLAGYARFLQKLLLSSGGVQLGVAKLALNSDQLVEAAVRSVDNFADEATDAAVRGVAEAVNVAAGTAGQGIGVSRAVVWLAGHAGLAPETIARLKSFAVANPEQYAELLQRAANSVSKGVDPEALVSVVNRWSEVWESQPEKLVELVRLIERAQDAGEAIGLGRVVNQLSHATENFRNGAKMELVAAVHTLDELGVDDYTVKSFREYVRNSGLGTTDIDVVLKPAAGAPANAPTVFVQAKTSNAAMGLRAQVLWGKKAIEHAKATGLSNCQLRFVSGSPDELGVLTQLMDELREYALEAGLEVQVVARNIENLP